MTAGGAIRDAERATARGTAGDNSGQTAGGAAGSGARPLRVLHLTAGSDAGGVSRYIFDLARAMRGRGHRVAAAGQRGAWHELFEGGPAEWIDVPLKGGPRAFLQCVRRLRVYLRTHPVDVLHAHYRRGTLLGRALQFFKKIPILYTVHLSHISLAWPRRPFSDFGDHTHVPSETTRRWLTGAGHLPGRMITLIPHGIESARYPVPDAATRHAARAALGCSPADRVAAYVGRFDTPKNESWVLDLAHATRDALPDLRLLLVGNGPHETDLRRQVHERGLAGRVRMLSYRDPLPVYQAIDALLLPSSQEGFSLVCGEAMSAGVPVLRTRTAGTPELIVEDVTGRSTPIDRGAFLREAASFLADGPALARMGRAAARHVREHLTFEAQVDRTIELYRFLIGKRQRR